MEPISETPPRSARPGLAASRAVAIINFLAAHPTESFSLSELVRRLGINVASAHAIIGVLTDSGYLSRHARHKTYALGPALVAVGTAALDHHRAIDEARDEIRRLTEELELELTVSAPVGDEIIIVAHAGRHLPYGDPVHVGQRVPLAPPLGGVFLAWGPDDAIERWLSRGGRTTSAEAMHRARNALAVIRSRGYAVGLEADAHRQLVQAIDQLADRPRATDLREKIDGLLGDLAESDYQSDEIDSSANYAVGMVAAPVFDTEGRVLLALTLSGFPPSMAGKRLLVCANRLRSAALVVTKRIRGRQP